MFVVCFILGMYQLEKSCWQFAMNEKRNVMNEGKNHCGWAHTHVCMHKAALSLLTLHLGGTELRKDQLW